jgi:hypothetical protein
MKQITEKRRISGLVLFKGIRLTPSNKSLQFRIFYNRSDFSVAKVCDSHPPWQSRKVSE